MVRTGQLEGSTLGGVGGGGWVGWGGHGDPGWVADVGVGHPCCPLPRHGWFQERPARKCAFKAPKTNGAVALQTESHLGRFPRRGSAWRALLLLLLPLLLDYRLCLFDTVELLLVAFGIALHTFSIHNFFLAPTCCVPSGSGVLA